MRSFLLVVLLTRKRKAGAVVLKSRAVVLGEKMDRDCRVRLPASLLSALTWWANENGYSLARAVVVLLERALRTELEKIGQPLREAHG